MSEPFGLELAVRQCESGTASARGQKSVAARLRERTSKLVSFVERIVALEAEIARLREERRWIPVGERWPEDEVWVELAGPWGELIGWWDGEQWLEASDETFDCVVTHWRKRGPGPEANG